jgi:hypothetical protein
MTDADAINDAIEANRQALLRKQFKGGTVRHYVGPEDTFDEIPGGMLVRKDDKAALLVVPDGEYGA